MFSSDLSSLSICDLGTVSNGETLLHKFIIANGLSMLNYLIGKVLYFYVQILWFWDKEKGREENICAHAFWAFVGFSTFINLAKTGNHPRVQEATVMNKTNPMSVGNNWNLKKTPWNELHHFSL